MLVKKGKEATIADQGTYTASNLPVDGTTIEASDVNTDLQGLIDEFNKNVGTGKLTDGAVTPAKISATAWTDWTPAYSGSSSMTYTSVSTTVARYIQLGKLIFFQITAVGSVSGTPDQSLQFTLPVAARTSTGDTYAGGALCYDSGYKAGTWTNSSATLILVRKYDASNWNAGDTKQISVNGVYEAA